MSILDLDRLRAELRPRRVGRRIEWRDTTSSTNDDAWASIGSGEDADGLVIFAEHQTAGRGRMGRTWCSPRGASVLCSLALIDEANELSGGELALLAPLAACDAIQERSELLPSIRWPNDLVVSGRKLGGVLVESHRIGGRAVEGEETRAYVVGIGINCLQQPGHLEEPLKSTATSLEIESRERIDRTGVAIALLGAFDRWLTPAARCDERLHRAWLDRCESIGHPIRLRQGNRTFSGTVIDIDGQASLLVELDTGGIRKFDAADTTRCADRPIA